MARCIYCLKDDGSTAFTSREHVIPASLGSFEPLNPTLTARDGLVCDACNGGVFSPLETVFREDTFEGIYGQRLNIQNRNSVVMRDNNFKVKQLAGFGDDFFDGMFLFLKPGNRKIVADLRNQIKIRRLQGGCRVFMPEALEKIADNSSKFRQISSDLKNLDKKDMRLFGEDRKDIERMATLLRRFGVDYQEKELRHRLFKPGEKLTFHEEYTCTLNMDMARVLTKTAFNYFAYCALQSSQQCLLYTAHFDTIRTFSLTGGGVSNLHEIIPSINEKSILWEEREQRHLLLHLINFLVEDGNIVCRMTFFGLPAIYKIIIGTFPREIANERFGCGHAFDPFGHRIINLSQTPPAQDQTGEYLRTTFGLFKRV